VAEKWGDRGSSSSVSDSKFSGAQEVHSPEQVEQSRFEETHLLLAGLFSGFPKDSLVSVISTTGFSYCKSDAT